MPGVFLVGFMGSGKSTVGARLAELLGLRFVDLDQVVEERCGAPIREIFDHHGERFFRDQESAALAWALELGQAVVALGGGAFSSAANRDAIAAAGGLSVFLDLPWEAICGRLPGTNPERPKFQDEARARDLYQRRLDDYRRAEMVLELDGSESPVEVAQAIQERLPEVVCVS
jgi:shikimate kinase